MKKVFILLGVSLLGGGSFGEVLSNGPLNGNAYECRVYDGTTSVPVEMVFVKGGTLSGTSITVGDFYIGKYEVTQKQWVDVMGSLPYTQNAGSGDNYPVHNVTWTEAKKFIAALNVMNGGGSKFRLPTEAEWEYAARGGNPQQTYYYAGSNTIGDVAWYYDNSAVGGTRQTHPVNDNATKLANGIGAYHMNGNVWEWCEDRYQSSGIAATPPATGSDRVIRGGSWSNVATSCTVSYRTYINPGNRYDYVGFRLACSSNP